MAELASGPAGEVSGFFLPYADRGIRYLLQFRTIMLNLDSKMRTLMSRKNDVERRVEAAMRNAEIILGTVTTWLKIVQELENEVNMLRHLAADVNRSYRGWLSGSRFKLGKRAQKKIEAIQGLLDEVASFADVVSHPNHIQGIGATGDFIPMEDYVVFQSRESVKHKILNVLKDDSISLVGVHGIAGVGKTVLITALANHAKRENIFDDVVMLTLGQNPEIQNVQGNIAIQIGLRFQFGDTTLTRAQRLSLRLNQNRKTLIILDNLQERVDLAAVGVLYRGSKNCKVVFTTRHEEVCRYMDTQTRIKIEALTEQESWHLFRQKTGHPVGTVAFYLVAIPVLKYCNGRPSEIVGIGRALHGEDKLAVWVKTIQQQMRIKFSNRFYA